MNTKESCNSSVFDSDGDCKPSASFVVSAFFSGWFSVVSGASVFAAFAGSSAAASADECFGVSAFSSAFCCSSSLTGLSSFVS
jgi:hypothetical protein